MRRLMILAVSLAGTVALADVGPKPAPCDVKGKGCQSCTAPAGQPDSACVAAATDAGLTLSDCSDRSGAVFTNYYCPPGTTVTHSSCAAVPEGMFPFAGLLFLVTRRRR